MFFSEKSVFFFAKASNSGLNMNVLGLGSFIRARGSLSVGSSTRCPLGCVATGGYPYEFAGLPDWASVPYRDTGQAVTSGLGRQAGGV